MKTKVAKYKYGMANLAFSRAFGPKPEFLQKTISQNSLAGGYKNQILFLISSKNGKNSNKMA